MAIAILELPRTLIYSYFRAVGLVMLIVYSLWLRFWDGVKPSLGPILNIYHTVDHDDVTITTITQQFVKTVLMVGVLYWKAVTTVWDTVTKPFRKQVDAVSRWFQELQEDYKEKKKVF